MNNNIHVSSMLCDLYNSNNQYSDILINLFQCPMPLAVYTGARTPAESIRIWHTCTIIWTREWQNNKRSFHLYCLYSYIILIENQWSRMCPVHTRDHSLKQAPRCWDQRQPAKTKQVRRNEKSEGSQHYHVPCSRTNMYPWHSPDKI